MIYFNYILCHIVWVIWVIRARFVWLIPRFHFQLKFWKWFYIDLTFAFPVFNFPGTNSIKSIKYSGSSGQHESFINISLLMFFIYLLTLDATGALPAAELVMWWHLAEVLWGHEIPIWCQSTERCGQRWQGPWRYSSPSSSTMLPGKIFIY